MLASWALFSALINLYIFAFGAVTLAVELMAARKFSSLHRIRQEVEDEAQFLLHVGQRLALHFRWLPRSKSVEPRVKGPVARHGRWYLCHCHRSQQLRRGRLRHEANLDPAA